MKHHAHLLPSDIWFIAVSASVGGVFLLVLFTRLVLQTHTPQTP